jgi:ubiquinone biosynthesis protein
MLGKKIKHAQRYQEIINAFLRNGFSYLVYRLGLAESAASKKQQETEANMNLRTVGEKLRNILQGLGPTFIKLGQIASTRRDLVPEEIIYELEQLQDQVTSFSYKQVRDIIEEELGDTVENLFQDFNETPLATASIGQVHIARLPTGEQVAVKIQRPDIQPIVETDLEILDHLAKLMEAKLSWVKNYQIRHMIYEFSNSLRDELDYNIEGRNGERLAKQFKDNQDIHIPKIYWQFSTKKVLTMEFIQGIKINQLEQLKERGYNQKVIAERLAESMLHQILIEGFFHGDPHPGNIYVLPGNVISYIDFGMTGRLTDEMKYNFASLFINLQRGNSKGIIKTFAAMELLSDETNISSLHNELDAIKIKYYDIPLSQLSLGSAINDLFSIANHHQIQIPTELTILGKALLTLDGIIEQLDPNFSIMQAAEPFGKKLLRKRYDPKTIVKKSWNQLIETAEILSELPKSLKDVTSTIQKGKLRLDISVPELRLFLHRLDKISNRLSFSIILLAFSILMVGLIIGSAISGHTTVLWRIPAIEIGSVIATLMFLFMLFSIFKSGRM